jgi:rare lipoprotein A
MKFLKTISVLALFALLSTSPLFAQEEYTQEASVYAIGRYGKKMSNGDYLSSRHKTCSHEFLPVGSLIQVTNPANNRSEVVEVNGKSQSTGIELTHSVAHDLGFTGGHKPTVKVFVMRKGDGNSAINQPVVAEKTSRNMTYGSQTAYSQMPIFTNPEKVEKTEAVVEKKKTYEFPNEFRQHERVTDISQLKSGKVEKVDSVAKKKEVLIKLDTEEKPSRPIPTLKMKIDDN